MNKCVLLALCFAVSLSAQIKQTAEKIVLDGKLDEPAWKTAAAYSQFRPFSDSGKKTVAAQTEFRLLYADNALYIGVRCSEPDMSKIKAPKSGAIWSMDGVEFFMSPTGQPDEYYQFLVTAGNIRWSMWYGEGGAIHPDPYAPFWDSKVFFGPDYWSAEAKIPLSAFYMTRNQKWKTDWLFNISRSRRGAAYENSTWSPLKHSSHETKLFKTIKGFPARKAYEDIYIRSIATSSVSTMSGGYRATCNLEIEAQKESAGQYNIELASPGQAPVRQSIVLAAGLNKISVPSIFFAKQGKNDITARLISNKSELGRIYPANLSYRPVSIHLTNPVYSNTFYPDQKCSKAEGFLNISVEKPVTATVSISGSGIPKTVKTLKNAKGKTPFSFEISGMNIGAALISADLFDNGKKIASESLVLRRVNTPKFDWYRVENGAVLKNGKAIFPRDVYAKYYQGGEAFRKKYDSDRLFVSKMQNVVLEPFRIVGMDIEPETVKDIRPSQRVFDAVKRAVERNRGKNFTFYYLSDEPECRNISPIYLKYMYDYVKELDPYHPVLIGSRAASAYLDCADVFSTHPYPDPFYTNDTRSTRLVNTPIHKSRNFIRDISRLNRSDKAIGLTPQFFSYGNITNRYSDYLTFEEQEASIWSSIVNGARLQWIYAYHDLGDRPTLYEGMKYIFESVETLENILCSGKTVKLKSDNEMLEGVLIENGKEQLLIICNVSDKPEKGTLTSSRKWQNLFEFRGIGALESGNKISKTFRPLEVSIYRNVQTKGLKTRADVIKMIAEMEKARKNRGNILFSRGYEIEVASSASTKRNSLCEQGKLFDGTTDMLAWTHDRRGTQAWYEISFPKFVPTFSKIRLHGYNIDGASVKIWKFGEWKNITVKPVKTGEYSLEWNLGKATRTVKARFDFDANSKNNKVELYEIEMVK